MLMALTDPAQNSDFKDKYFASIPIDLSKAIMVFSFNDKSQISPILLDRIKVIDCEHPNAQRKCEIARKHLLPEALRLADMEGSLLMDDECISEIISATDETGVRDLGRNIRHVVNTLNVACRGNPSLMGISEDILEHPVKLPLQCTRKLCKALLPKGSHSQGGSVQNMMYA